MTANGVGPKVTRWRSSGPAKGGPGVGTSVGGIGSRPLLQPQYLGRASRAVGILGVVALSAQQNLLCPGYVRADPPV